MNYHISNAARKVEHSFITSVFERKLPDDTIVMMGGSPSAELFPKEQLSRLASEVLSEGKSLDYGFGFGYAKLRERLKEACPFAGVEDAIVMTSGGQQGIYMTAAVLTNPGDTILVEQPTFVAAIDVFKGVGANVVGVSLEQDGINIESLKAAIASEQNIRFLYTIPNFQNPSGITMSAKKRREVYEICRDAGILILEDDPYGSLRFTDQQIAPIKSYDSTGTVIYCSSFSKIIAPGLRVGWLLLPRELAVHVGNVKASDDVHSSLLPQIVIERFMEQCDLEGHISTLCREYSERCRLMLDAIDKYFPSRVTRTNPTGGLFVWCDLGEGHDSYKLYDLAIEHGVAFVPGIAFYSDSRETCSAFRLNYSSMPKGDIVEGVKRIAKAIEQYFAV